MSRARRLVIALRRGGTAPEQLDQMFTASYRTKVQGLAISRSIVEPHGGRLWAAANSGYGATFRFAFPSELDLPNRQGHDRLIHSVVERSG